MSILLDMAEKNEGLPEFDFNVRCKDHPRSNVNDGFGLAGGGFGSYTYCSECGEILSKTVIPDDE